MSIFKELEDKEIIKILKISTIKIIGNRNSHNYGVNDTILEPRRAIKLIRINGDTIDSISFNNFNNLKIIDFELLNVNILIGQRKKIENKQKALQDKLKNVIKYEEEIKKMNEKNKLFYSSNNLIIENFIILTELLNNKKIKNIEKLYKLYDILNNDTF